MQALCYNTFERHRREYGRDTEMFSRRCFIGAGSALFASGGLAAVRKEHEPDDDAPQDQDQDAQEDKPKNS